MLHYLGGAALALPSTSAALRHLTRGAAGSLALKLVNMALVYGTTVLLARLLGAEGYGAYAFALAWVQLALVPAMLGMEPLAVREVARGQSATDPSVVRGIVRFGGTAALAAALSICAGVSVILHFAPAWPSPSLNEALAIGIWLLPLLAATRVLGGCIRGLQRIVLAQVPTFLIVPLALLLGLLAIAPGGPSGFSIALWLHMAAAAVGLLAAALALDRVWRQGMVRGPASYRMRAWFASALPFMLIGSTQVINLQMDRVMLGAMTDAGTVGIYAVAARNAALVELFLLAMNMALAPYVADRFAGRELGQLQSVVTATARLVLACSLPAALGLIVLGPWLLGLFGPEFTQSQSVLVILVLAHLSAVLSGAPGLILSMTGHERTAVVPIAVSALMNVALNLLLIPSYGMLGAAAATFASSLIWRVLLAYAVVRRVGVDPTPFGLFAPRPHVRTG